MRSVLIVAVLLISLGRARGDFPPLSETACDGRREGDACLVAGDTYEREVGHCVAKPDCERPEHPELGTHPCLLCKPKPAPPASSPGLPLVIATSLVAVVLASVFGWYVHRRRRRR